MKTSPHRAARQSKLTPSILKNVAFTGGFWAARIENNRRVTLPLEYRLCKQTGRIDA